MNVDYPLMLLFAVTGAVSVYSLLLFAGVNPIWSLPGVIALFNAGILSQKIYADNAENTVVVDNEW